MSDINGALVLLEKESIKECGLRNGWSCLACTLFPKRNATFRKLPFSRGARVSFGLWILKVKGPTLNLLILNAEVVLITVWGATF